jgi:hypothetical protein
MVQIKIYNILPYIWLLSICMFFTKDNDLYVGIVGILALIAIFFNNEIYKHKL